MRYLFLLNPLRASRTALSSSSRRSEPLPPGGWSKVDYTIHTH